MIETRNNSGQVLAQQAWGTQYIDELAQTAANDDPASPGRSPLAWPGRSPADASEQDCETFHYALAHANFNVLRLAAAAGGPRPPLAALQEHRRRSSPPAKTRARLADNAPEDRRTQPVCLPVCRCQVKKRSVPFLFPFFSLAKISYVSRSNHSGRVDCLLTHGKAVGCQQVPQIRIAENILLALWSR